MKTATNVTKRLTKNDIIGRKILRVYEIKGPRVERFQPREIFVHLDNEIIFDMDSIRDPKLDQPLNIQGAEYKKSFVTVLSIDKDPNLNSPIKSIVFAEHFENGSAILLENDFILTVGVGEFGMGHLFYLPSEEFRKYTAMEIAG